MDSSSWIHRYTANSTGGSGNGGFMCGYTASRFPSASLCREDEEQQHELLLNAQIQQHLNQARINESKLIHSNTRSCMQPAIGVSNFGM
jgi:hypothetical protein